MPNDHPRSIDRNRLPAREIEQMQEIVIRAHYLALELRDICAPSGLADPLMSRSVSDLLRQWALLFGAELRRAGTSDVPGPL